MNIFEIVILVLSIVIAVVSVVWSIIVIKKLLSLRKILSNATVIAPLFKRSKWTHFSAVMLVVCLIADIVYLAVFEAYVVCACILLIIVALLALLQIMIYFRCAILDIGIMLPYKFIPWDKFHDYGFDNDAIFFCGDKEGFDTLTASTTRLDFIQSDKYKIIELLDKYKKNK